jgi:hypothetical protein
MSIVGPFTVSVGKLTIQYVGQHSPHFSVNSVKILQIAQREGNFLRIWVTAMFLKDFLHDFNESFVTEAQLL